MTDQEKITNHATLEHIAQVRRLLDRIIIELLRRAEQHDQSKLTAPELQTFVEYTPKLAQSTYGSAAYQEYLRAMKPALDHHYAQNRHHPEHFPDGVNDMNLVDLLEMLCDWQAATLRQRDGDLTKSLAISQARFGISDQLARILQNTIALFEDE